MQRVIYAVIFGLVVGFGAGFYTKGEFDKADRLDTVVAQNAETSKAIEDTAKAEVKLEEAREKVRTEIKYVTKEIVKYVPVTQSASDCQLSVGAVGLLNSARTGTNFQPSVYSDAQSKAHSGVGLRELSVADIELAEQYRQLAADHDALVEYVEAYQRRLKEAVDQ